MDSEKEIVELYFILMSDSNKNANFKDIENIFIILARCGIYIKTIWISPYGFLFNSMLLKGVLGVVGNTLFLLAKKEKPCMTRLS